MEKSEYDDLVQQFKNDFVMITKGRFYFMVGGFFAFILAAGLITINAFEDVVLNIKRTFEYSQILHKGKLSETESGIEFGSPVFINGKLVARSITSQDSFENRGDTTVLSGTTDRGAHHLLVSSAGTPISIGDGYFHIGNSGNPTNLWVSGSELKIDKYIVDHK